MQDDLRLALVILDCAGNADGVLREWLQVASGQLAVQADGGESLIRISVVEIQKHRAAPGRVDGCDVALDCATLANVPCRLTGWH